MKKYNINDSKKLLKAFKTNKSEIFSNKLIQYLYEDLNTLSEHIKQTTKFKIACSKGCSLCCNARVEILEPEAIFIYTYMKNNLHTEQLESIFNKIKEITTITSQIDKNQHVQLQLPCIFLNNNECSIYEIRPFICREYHSVDLNSCLRHYVNLEENAGALEANKIKDSYYRIMLQYRELYTNNNLEFSPSEFLSSLLKIHEDKEYMKKYFRKI